MAIFSVDIPANSTISGTSTNSMLAGITAARLAHNSEFPAAPIATDEAYVQFVLHRAAISYAKQYGT